MPIERLKKHLADHHVSYDTLHHRTAYSAQEVAAAAHVSGKQLAKAVVVKLDDKPVVVVLPASELVDIDKLRQQTGAGSVELAAEEEVAALFPECEPGAVPAFADLWNLRVLVSRPLANRERIAVSSGKHDEVMIVGYEDFQRVEHAPVLDVSRPT